MMQKTCGHDPCGEKDFAGASWSECQTCGRMVCHGIGTCFCSDFQAKNPIRRGIGAYTMVQQASGMWVSTYPLATAEALADPDRVRFMNRDVAEVQEMIEEIA